MIEFLLQYPDVIVLLPAMSVSVMVLRGAVAAYQSHRTRITNEERILIALMERQDELNRQSIDAMREHVGLLDEYQQLEKPKRDSYFYEDES